MKQYIFRGLLLSLSLLLSMSAIAQSIQLKGKVVDKSTKEPIEFATIAIVGSSKATKTDEQGNFEFTVPAISLPVRVSYVGYESIQLDLTQNKSFWYIELSAENEIEAVVIKRPKLKYSNKNNPAVELIRQVIAHRDQNRIVGQEYVEFEQYEKITLGLSNLSSKFVGRKAFKNYQFLFQKESDSTSTYALPAFMEEKVSKV